MAYEDNNPSTPQAVRQHARESRANVRGFHRSLRDQMREEEQARKAEAAFERQSKRLRRVMDRQGAKTERVGKRMDKKALLRAEAEATLQEQMADEQKRLLMEERARAVSGAATPLEGPEEPTQEELFMEALEGEQRRRREADLLKPQTRPTLPIELEEREDLLRRRDFPEDWRQKIDPELRKIIEKHRAMETGPSVPMEEEPAQSSETSSPSLSQAYQIAMERRRAQEGGESSLSLSQAMSAAEERRRAQEGGESSLSLSQAVSAAEERRRAQMAAASGAKREAASATESARDVYKKMYGRG